jgi:hypothetical protein
MTAVQVVLRAMVWRDCWIPTCDLDQHWLIKESFGRPRSQDVPAGRFGSRLLVKVIFRPLDHFMHILNICEIGMLRRPTHLFGPVRRPGFWQLLLPESDSVLADWNGVAGLTWRGDKPHRQSMAAQSPARVCGNVP